MPTYEYECPACGHHFERFQRINDPPVRTCPTCGKRKVRRLISGGGGIVFKGPGFYATDYRKSPKASEHGTGDRKAPKAGAGQKGDSSVSGDSGKTGASRGGDE